MVLPRLSGMYAASERAGERRLLLDDIAALPYAAYAARETFTLTSYPGQPQELPVDVPKGWQLTSVAETVSRVKISAVCLRGTCEPGQADVEFV